MAAWLSRSQWLRALVPALGMVMLWWSSAQVPSELAPSVVRQFFRNGMHVVAYAALGGSLLMAAVSRRTDGHHRPASVWAFVIAVGYGAVDELHQSFVPGRVCSVVDLLSDACGAALAITGLRTVLHSNRLPSAAVSILIAASVASVSLATWGPW